MSFYKKYIAPYYIYLLLLLGAVVLEVGHYWLHHLDAHHSHGAHHHSHTHTTEDHHGHDHIKELFVLVAPPTHLHTHQPSVVAPTGKYFTKPGLFFCLKQSLYTFSLSFYQASNVSVTIVPASPPPQV
ncbi:hypothetical protein [uncultured Microscilla sp.]|uniref:hypothetical protein n=1 Tax=uncultured Microscilla sp. TaxID=432653 RepID=UPI00260555B3|nr:hypothetical protein [uncultured Microscilla sp.]